MPFKFICNKCKKVVSETKDPIEPVDVVKALKYTCPHCGNRLRVYPININIYALKINTKKIISKMVESNVIREGDNKVSSRE